MPIRPENRGRYPADWPEISHHIRYVRAELCCECEGECGRGHVGRCTRRHNTPLTMESSGPRVVLTVAHRNHTPEDCRPENLFAACQAGHLAYDRDHHARTAAATRERQRTAAMEPLFGEATGA